MLAHLCVFTGNRGPGSKLLHPRISKRTDKHTVIFTVLVWDPRKYAEASRPNIIFHILSFRTKHLQPLFFGAVAAALSRRLLIIHLGVIGPHLDCLWAWPRGSPITKFYFRYFPAGFRFVSFLRLVLHASARTLSTFRCLWC